jgi:hypothetical protein
LEIVLSVRRRDEGDGGAMGADDGAEGALLLDLTDFGEIAPVFWEAGELSMELAFAHSPDAGTRSNKLFLLFPSLLLSLPLSLAPIHLSSPPPNPSLSRLLSFSLSLLASASSSSAVTDRLISSLRRVRNRSIGSRMMK